MLIKKFNFRFANQGWFQQQHLKTSVSIQSETEKETKKILRCVLYDKLKCAIAPSLNYSDLQSSADSRSNLNLPSPEDKLAGRLFLDVYFGLNSYSFDRSPR